MSESRKVYVKQARQRGKRYLVEIHTGDEFRLDCETVFRHNVFTDSEFTLERWAEILEDSRAAECYGKLLGMINRRAHTVTEVQQKLRKAKYEDKFIKEAVDRALEVGLLDDEQFARLFAEERLNYGMVGRRRVVADMQRRGISRKLIDEALEALDQKDGENREWVNARTLAERKWRSLERESDLMKRKKKLLSYLAGRGFTADICYRALDTVAPGNVDD